MACPNQVDLSPRVQSCEWTERTEPRYRANMGTIEIAINGTNSLEPGGVIFRYEFQNAEIGTYLSMGVQDCSSGK
jgi:hypothetical protein